MHHLEATHFMVDNSSTATDFSPVDERKKYIF